jgi:membrane-bound lytic murein transglycosylase MltF
MKVHVNIRFVATLAIASLVFYGVGVSQAQRVKQENSSLEYIKATTASFQVNEARYLAFQLLTSKQFTCLDYVLTHESHWNSKAKNPKSSARGIGQLLDETYRNIGMKHSTDSRAQLIATLAYISRWYGSAGPCGAKAHWLKHKWY